MQYHHHNGPAPRHPAGESRPPHLRVEFDRHPPKMIILDMDSSVSPTHGEQEGTAYNGHFGCTCYHPLFLFNQFGDLDRSSGRENVGFSSERFAL
jgi:hypothetical protein